VGQLKAKYQKYRLAEIAAEQNAAAQTGRSLFHSDATIDGARMQIESTTCLPYPVYAAQAWPEMERRQ
jgi:hypothetical protein